MKNPMDWFLRLLIAAGAVAGIAASLMRNSAYPGERSQPNRFSPLAGPVPAHPAEGAPGGGRTVPDGYVCEIVRGLPLSHPNDPHAKTFADSVLRQLEGRYFLGANGHLYIRATNQEYVAACRRFFPGPTGSFETWSWLAEIAHFGGPEVWSLPRDSARGAKGEGEQWRGGFAFITRLFDHEGETICRFFSHQERSWTPWRPGVVAIGADASLNRGRWQVQWRLEAERGRFVLGNDPTVHPEDSARFREPFFLLPIAANDVPAF